MFAKSFTKTADETPTDEKPTKLVSEAWLKRREDRENEAWSKVQNLLSEVNDHKPEKTSEFSVGTRVLYNGETGWKHGEDARHIKGNWDLPDGESADWDKDGISIGDRGVVVKVDNNNVWVNWDKHHYKDHSRKWIGSYRPRELKKTHRSMTEWEQKRHDERMSQDFEKSAVSREWTERHVLSGLNKRFAKYRGLSHPKATAKAYAEGVSHSDHAKDELHHLREIFPKRKAAKDVY